MRGECDLLTTHYPPLTTHYSPCGFQAPHSRTVQHRRKGDRHALSHVERGPSGARSRALRASRLSGGADLAGDRHPGIDRAAVGAGRKMAAALPAARRRRARKPAACAAAAAGSAAQDALAADHAACRAACRRGRAAWQAPARCRRRRALDALCRRAFEARPRRRIDRGPRRTAAAGEGGGHR